MVTRNFLVTISTVLMFKNVVCVCVCAYRALDVHFGNSKAQCQGKRRRFTDKRLTGDKRLFYGDKKLPCVHISTILILPHCRQAI